MLDGTPGQGKTGVYVVDAVTFSQYTSVLDEHVGGEAQLRELFEEPTLAFEHSHPQLGVTLSLEVLISEAPPCAAAVIPVVSV